jgi:hypothetical protein
MAQAVMATLLRQPDTARARPSSLLKDDKRYDSVFNDDLPLGLFLVSAAGMKHIEHLLREDKYNLSSKDRNNVRFYALMAAIQLATQKLIPSASEIDKVGEIGIDESKYRTAIDLAIDEYTKAGSSDTTAKGPALKNEITNRVAAILKDEA